MIQGAVPREHLIWFSSLPIFDKFSCCKKLKQFFLSFEIHVFFKIQYLCMCRFFLCCCSPFCNTSFNSMFWRFKILCLVVQCTKNEVFRFLQLMWSNPQFPADLVTLTEEIPLWKTLFFVLRTETRIVQWIRGKTSR